MYGMTEITECSVLLLHSAFAALHIKIARNLGHISVGKQLRRGHQARCGCLVLPITTPSLLSYHLGCLHLLLLLTRSRLFWRHTNDE